MSRVFPFRHSEAHQGPNASCSRHSRAAEREREREREREITDRRGIERGIEGKTYRERERATENAIQEDEMKRYRERVTERESGSQQIKQ